MGLSVCLSVQMTCELSQYRSAIGLHNNFVKSKENKLICGVLRIIRDLYNYFGFCLIPMFYNMSYVQLTLLLIMYRCGVNLKTPGPTLGPQCTKFCHINARSLLSGVDKDLHLDSQYSLLDEIYETLIFDHSFDIIGISETWLDDSTIVETLDLVGYHTPYVKHRPARGGGVMLYVRSELVAKRRDEFEFDGLELLWVEVKIGQ